MEEVLMWYRIAVGVLGVVGVGGVVALVKLYGQLKKQNADTAKTSREADKLEVDVRKEYQELYQDEVKANQDRAKFYMEKYFEADKENVECRKQHRQSEHLCEERINDLQRQLDELKEKISRIKMRLPELEI